MWSQFERSVNSTRFAGGSRTLFQPPSTPVDLQRLLSITPSGSPDPTSKRPAKERQHRSHPTNLVKSSPSTYQGSR